jgi:nucleoid-associated protein YgaU
MTSPVVGCGLNTTRDRGLGRAAREYHDLIRATLDGRPTVDNGIAIPGATTLAELLTRTDQPWSPQLPNDGEQALADFVTRMTAEPIALLRSYLESHRKAVARGKRRHRHPTVENSLKRLDLGEHVVDAALVAKDRPTPQPHPRQYTVKPGDTLVSIARRFHVEGGWRALYRANRTVIGDDPKAQKLRTRLTIPPDTQ